MSDSITNLSIIQLDKDERSEEQKIVCNDAKEIWAKFLKLLSQNLKEREIDAWFSVISPKSFENNVLTVTVPSKDYYGMIENRFNKHIVGIIESGLLGENGKLSYEISQRGLFDNSENETGEHEKIKSESIIDFKYPYNNRNNKTEPAKKEEKEPFESNLLPRHTFENYVKGESNDFAVTAAYAITNNLGKSYNPLFIYAGVGLGKTHLIQALGNEILKKHPDKKVYYTTAPDFTTQFTSHIAQGKIEFSQGKSGIKKLDEFYKSLDVLILDDVQNLSGKAATQDFMYQIFNVLYNKNKHIIFSCDKPLNQLKDIEERLVSRFKWGLSIDMQPPGWEMRVAIIQKKYEEFKTDVPEEVIHYIATNVKDSIRTLEGCVKGTISESILVYDGQITLQIAEKVVHRVMGTVKRERAVSIENIILTAAKYFNISENQILSRKRTKEIAFARQVAMYLTKELTSYTLESIGLNFGGKDHTTVLYAHNLIKKALKKDKKVINIINDIKEELSKL